MADEPRIAVFVDFENLAIGARDMRGQESFQIDVVLRRLLEKGRIVFKRAYCDWSRYRPATKELHQQGVELVDVPHTGMSGKNSADIHLVVDALELCHAKQHIDVFALLTGDSDFSPLVAKLKENDKRVVGCGVKSSSSKLLIQSCDEFMYYDDLVRAKAQTRAPAPKPEAERPGVEKSEGDKRAEALSLADRDRQRPRGGLRGALGLDGEADAEARAPRLQRVLLRLPRLRRSARGRRGQGPGRARLGREARQLPGPPRQAEAHARGQVRLRRARERGAPFGARFSSQPFPMRGKAGLRFSRKLATPSPKSLRLKLSAMRALASFIATSRGCMSAR